MGDVVDMIQALLGLWNATIGQALAARSMRPGEVEFKRNERSRRRPQTTNERGLQLGRDGSGSHVCSLTLRRAQSTSARAV